MNKAGPIGSAAVVTGLVIYALFGHLHYIWTALSLMLVAAGIRIVMITATINVMRAIAIGASPTHWTTAQATAFQHAVTLGTLVLAATTTALITWARVRSKLP